MTLNTPPERPQDKRSCKEILDDARPLGIAVILLSTAIACLGLMGKLASESEKHRCLRLVEAIDPDNLDDITLEQLCTNTELQGCFYNFSTLPEEPAKKIEKLRETHGLKKKAPLHTICDRFEKNKSTDATP